MDFDITGSEYHRRRPKLFKWRPALEPWQSSASSQWQPDDLIEEYDYTESESDACQAETDALILAVNASRRILSLKDDWDGEGSKGYDEATWQRATDLLMTYVASAHSELETVIGIPKISPADAGSIDLFWKRADRTLLINIPSSPEQAPTYYGEAASGDSVAGTLKSDLMNLILVTWLSAR